MPQILSEKFKLKRSIGLDVRGLDHAITQVMNLT